MARKRGRYCPNGHDTEVVGRYSNGTCKTCSDAAVADWRRRNPDKHRSHRVKATRKANGIINPTGETRTSGVCELCGSPSQRLCLDHSHKTGMMRGWVCYRCNTRLGQIEKPDWESWLLKAKHYLTGTNAQ